MFLFQSEKYPPLPVFRDAQLKESILFCIVDFCFTEFSFAQVDVRPIGHVGLQGSKDQCAGFIW